MSQPPYGEPEQPQQPQRPPNPYEPNPCEPGSHAPSPYGSYQPPPPPQSASGSPYQAYPQAYPQQPYAYSPPQRSHTTRNVLIAVVVVVVLVCGGGIAGIAALVSNVDSQLDTSYRGSEDDPLTVTEGQEFEIRGFTYAAGWSIASGASAESAIKGLSTTNDRDDEDSGRASLTFTMLDGTRIVQQFSCYANADIAYGRTATLDCDGLYEKLPAYETLEVYDQSFYE